MCAHFVCASRADPRVRARAAPLQSLQWRGGLRGSRPAPRCTASIGSPGGPCTAAGPGLRRTAPGDAGDGRRRGGESGRGCGRGFRCSTAAQHAAQCAGADGSEGSRRRTARVGSSGPSRRRWLRRRRPGPRAAARRGRTRFPATGCRWRRRPSGPPPSLAPTKCALQTCMLGGRAAREQLPRRAPPRNVPTPAAPSRPPAPGARGAHGICRPARRAAQTGPRKWHQGPHQVLVFGRLGSLHGDRSPHTRRGARSARRQRSAGAPRLADFAGARRAPNARDGMRARSRAPLTCYGAHGPPAEAEHGGKRSLARYL